jgi:hypothetical protein
VAFYRAHGCFALSQIISSINEDCIKDRLTINSESDDITEILDYLDRVAHCCEINLVGVSSSDDASDLLYCSILKLLKHTLNVITSVCPRSFFTSNSKDDINLLQRKNSVTENDFSDTDTKSASTQRTTSIDALLTRLYRVFLNICTLSKNGIIVQGIFDFVSSSYHYSIMAEKIPKEVMVRMIEEAVANCCRDVNLRYHNIVDCAFEPTPNLHTLRNVVTCAEMLAVKDPEFSYKVREGSVYRPRG